MKVFGIDPGSERTGYGCVETDGRRHRLVIFGTISAKAGDSFPARLARIHRELSSLLATCRPDCVAVENVFHAANVRSALKLGHARGVAMLAAVEAGCEVAEYTPAEVKRAVVGYGRAEKHQVQQMVKLLLGLDRAPSPHDASDALAVALCHAHSAPLAGLARAVSAADARAALAARSQPARAAAAHVAAVSSARARMIGFLRGQILEKQPNRLIVDVHGVGYDVHVPLSTYYQIGEEGSEVALRVYTHVREEALQLYGFLTDLERQLFERLIGISGIGPKLAVALLSGHGAAGPAGCRAAGRCRAADGGARHRQEDRRAHRAGAEGPRRRPGPLRRQPRRPPPAPRIS